MPKQLSAIGALIFPLEKDALLGRSFMWDAITKALEIILPELIKKINSLKSGDAKSRRKAAKDLMRLYISLSDIYIQAVEIQNTLKIYIDRIEFHMANGDDEYALTFGRIIEGHIAKQMFALSAFEAQLIDISDLIGAVGGEIYAQLRVFADHKQGALGDLRRMLRNHLIPLGPLEIEIRKTKHRDHTITNFNGILDMRVQWGEKEYLIVKDYYNSGQISERIVEMAAFLTQLRSQMGSVFSVDDLLLGVVKRGDRLS